MNNKERYIDEVLKSLEGIQQAAASPFTETRIFASLEGPAKDEVATVWGLKPAFARFAFCSLAVLFACNIYFFSTGLSQAASKGDNCNKSVSDIVVEGYFSYTEF